LIPDKLKPGNLYLIPSFISETSIPGSLPSLNQEIIKGLDVFIVEELRTARRYLRSIGFSKDFDTILFFELNEHTNLTEIRDFLQPVLDGKNAGLISEAGTPCVADPGAELVMLAHQKGIRVIPLTGPNSIILALMASGLNGQNFIFHGYLPIDKVERKQAIKSLEKDIQTFGRTQIFIEAPYRNVALFDALISNCSNDIKLCIACNITSTDEFIQTKSIEDWKKEKPDIHKKPTVFLINQ
jgi:16S rRNA (cytidine1402-2'-O)-methyltransferase